MQRQDEMLKRYALLCDQVPNEEHLSMMEKMRGIYYRTKTIKRFTRLIEANFTEADYYFTGTFEGVKLPTLDEVRKAVKRYIARINYEREKRGLEKARYVYVIEGYEDGSRQQRLHFHMVIDGALDRATLKEIWGGGRTKCEELDPKAYNGLIGLARYLAKDPKGRKRWSS